MSSALQSNTLELQEILNIVNDSLNFGTFLDGSIVAIDSPVTQVIAYACRGITTLKTVNVPNATSIGQYAFYGCSALESINAPQVTYLGQDAFCNCNDLRKLVLPNLVETGTLAFRNIQYAETIDLAKLPTIIASVFTGCRGLKALILRSENIVTLEDTSAFNSCYRINGTKNPGFNPNGEVLGFFYVPRALLSDEDETKDYRRATNWTKYASQFRAIEDYPEICG